VPGPICGRIELFSNTPHSLLRFNFDLQIYMFVLMSNHFHLIASTPESNISQCMHYFIKNVSVRLAKAGNRINETFARRHYKTILQSRSNYLNAYKYNYQNPVVAGIVSKVEDYRYSTLCGLLGRKSDLSSDKMTCCDHE